MGQLAADAGITSEELGLAARNHAMPLEALRWPVTPVGLHYLLIHFDVPLVDVEDEQQRAQRQELIPGERLSLVAGELLLSQSPLALQPFSETPEQGQFALARFSLAGAR